MFNKQHIPYIVLSTFVTCTFVVVPCVLLILYPTRLFQRCLNRCGIRRHAIHAFADAFNGCYKNGANGTRDCRCFAGWYLFLRICYVAAISTTWKDNGLANLIMVLAAFFAFSLASPYKNKFFNVFDSFWMAFTACRIATATGRDVMNVLGVVLLVMYLISYICWKIASQLNCQCFQRLNLLINRLCTYDNNQHIQRDSSDVQGNLPDRVVNPEGYRLLSEELQVSYSSGTSGSNVPTYGIIQ